MPEPAQPQIDLERTLRLMDVADEIRRQHRRVHEHLELSDREKIKEHLLKRYEGMGHEADSSQLDEAIDIVLAQQYRFKNPKPGAALTLAKIYVRRSSLTRKIGIPIVALAGVLAAGSLAQTAFENSRASRREAAAEGTVVELHARQRALRSRVEALTTTSDGTSFDAAKLQGAQEMLSSATRRLDQAGQFFSAYAPAGSAREHVTRENYAEVNERATSVELDLDEAGKLLDQVEGLASQETALQDLSRRAELLYRNIRAVAEDPEALAQAERHHDDAQRHARGQAIERLGESVTALSRLEELLNQDYTLVIQRGRERDQVRHYLIVQAVTVDGTPLRMKVRNEENGRVEEVTEWGERVSRQTYDRVAADYSADQVIDDNVFGVKRRGYLEVERRHQNLGQITKY